MEIIEQETVINMFCQTSALQAIKVIEQKVFILVWQTQAMHRDNKIRYTAAGGNWTLEEAVR